MNTPTPTPTPRPALKATGMRRRHARCLETELAALAAERDQLRAEVKSCGELSCDECNARTAALTAERDQLRAALALGQINCDAEYDDLRDERDAALARAERAEADLAALQQCHDDNCRGVVKIAAELATAKELLRSEATDDYAAVKVVRRELAAERARLDWLLLDVVSRFDDAYYTRATIDAKMKEGAK